VLEVLSAPVVLDDRAISIGASVGVVAYPEHGRDPDTLLRHAELAMYAAKQTRGAYAVYSADQARQSAERLALIGTLPQALERDPRGAAFDGAGQLVLYYQPKVECRSRRMVGVEALVRWQHPELGLVAPDRFIGLAEETGLIAPLTRWVLDAALQQSRVWLDAGFEVPIAVNLSAFDVQDPRMPAVIAGLLARWNVPAGLLSVEITEGAVLADPAAAVDVLQQLRQLGVVAALDDFGSGYSSLSRLREMPMETLKIDRAFLRDVPERGEAAAIVTAILALARALGRTAVAEGVETAEQRDFLVAQGCGLLQGFLLGRPMPVAEVEALMAGALRSSPA
jgi:EAL domain-containing protein (putative c-di-GMP-specific phosphodiesterase class I)